MENFVHRNGTLGALVTDLSGAFDSLQHSPPAKKLHANGINKISTEYLRDYLRHWKQNRQLMWNLFVGANAPSFDKGSS